MTLQRQSQLREHFKQPEMTQPELWKQSRVTWTDDRPESRGHTMERLRTRWEPTFESWMATGGKRQWQRATFANWTGIEHKSRMSAETNSFVEKQNSVHNRCKGVILTHITGHGWDEHEADSACHNNNAKRYVMTKATLAWYQNCGGDDQQGTIGKEWSQHVTY